VSKAIAFPLIRDGKFIVKRWIGHLVTDFLTIPAFFAVMRSSNVFGAAIAAKNAANNSDKLPRDYLY